MDMEEFEFFPEEGEEEEVTEGESSNRTFIIVAGILGAILVLGICAFVVWAIFGNKWMENRIVAQNESVMATNTAATEIAMAADETATVEAQPTEEPPIPTDTLEPTEEPTPVPPPTEVPPAPTEVPTEAAAGDGEDATAEAGDATVEATDEAAGNGEADQTPAPTATLKPTPAPTQESAADSQTGSEQTPETGIGALGAAALAVGLIVVLVAVRRLRRTAA